MNIRPPLAGTALLLLASTIPAAAQVAPDMGPRPSMRALDEGEGTYRTPETLGAGRQMGSPAGDALTRPADPTVVPGGAESQPRTGEAAEERMDDAATSVIVPPAEMDDQAGDGQAGDEAADRTAAPADPAEQPAALRTEPPETVAGTVGGGALAEHQVYAQDLANYAVIGADGNEMGDVADVVVDVRSGRVESLVLSRGGLAGIGDTLYDMPWEAVSAIDRNAERLYIETDESMLRPDPQFPPAEADARE